ncbi:hypothetical protein C8R48DRAFT_614406, partial [Suillus tomentosus]
LQSPDGKEEACIFLKGGKNCEGYFIDQDILKQAERSMNILEKYYANTTTRLKCADGALPVKNILNGTLNVGNN